MIEGKKYKRLGLFVLILILAVALGACGGSGKDTKQAGKAGVTENKKTESKLSDEEMDKLKREYMTKLKEEQAEKIRKEVEAEVREELKKELRAEIEKEVSEEIDEEKRAKLKDEIKKELISELKDSDIGVGGNSGGTNTESANSGGSNSNKTDKANVDKKFFSYLDYTWQGLIDELGDAGNGKFYSGARYLDFKDGLHAAVSIQDDSDKSVNVLTISTTNTSFEPVVGLRCGMHIDKAAKVLGQPIYETGDDNTGDFPNSNTYVFQEYELIITYDADTKIIKSIEARYRRN